MGVEITTEQRREYLRCVCAAAMQALERSNLDEVGVRRVLGCDTNLSAAITDKIFELSGNKYINEEVSSGCAYPRGYCVRPVISQVVELCRSFPDISPDETIHYISDSLPRMVLPDGAEGWFAFPRWEKTSSCYGEAVERILATLATRRNVNSWREGSLVGGRIKPSERSLSMYASATKGQRGDIVIVPAQFGLVHRGRSVRRSRERFGGDEFGLGAFAVGCMLLTNPGRASSEGDLWIDCGGDEDTPVSGGDYSYAPSFDWNSKELRFDSNWTGRFEQGYGTATGYVPQGQ